MLEVLRCLIAMLRSRLARRLGREVRDFASLFPESSSSAGEPPNESRLSCGATLKYSQMEFYHTARQTFSGTIGDGRRQLQALLGCAPQVIARVLPFRGDQGALTVAGLPPGL